MRDEQVKAIFDQQAAGYDARWAKTAPIRDALHFLLASVFAALPDDARLLCVGAGTGEEIAYLAALRPGWSFTAVEPSGAMVEVCRRKAERLGFASRCQVHEGYLDSLPATAPFDAATSFLVSQFILDPAARTAFFAGIAACLRAGGMLASSDLAFDVASPAYTDLLQVWLTMMRGADVPAAAVDEMRAAYARDVAVLAPDAVAAIMAAGGFETPVRFYQAGLIHAWFARRA